MTLLLYLVSKSGFLFSSLASVMGTVSFHLPSFENKKETKTLMQTFYLYEGTSIAMTKWDRTFCFFELWQQLSKAFITITPPSGHNKLFAFGVSSDTLIVM